MSVCNIIRHKGRWTELRCDYNAAFIENLKELIPFIARTYDPATKVWTFIDVYTHEVVSLAKKHYKKCSLLEFKGSQVITTRLHTGAVEKQNSLFERGDYDSEAGKKNS